MAELRAIEYVQLCAIKMQLLLFIICSGQVSIRNVKLHDKVLFYHVMNHKQREQFFFCIRFLYNCIHDDDHEREYKLRQEENYYIFFLFICLIYGWRTEIYYKWQEETYIFGWEATKLFKSRNYNIKEQMSL